MKRWFLWMAVIGLMSLSTARADEQVTITATNSDISQGLDLRVVAKIFAEAKD